MFRDASEELERLQAELLAEEESENSQEPPEDQEEYEEFEDYDEPESYQNYANGYNAYNTDISDEDLEEYSEEVRNGKSRGGCCLAVIACLLCLMLAGVVLFIAYVKGYLP